MEYWLSFISAIAPYVLSLSAFLTSIFASRNKEAKDRIVAVEKRVERSEDKANRHANQIDRLNEEIARLPDASDLHKMQLTLSETNASIQALAQSMTSQNENVRRLDASVNRIEAFLLERSPR